MASPPFDASHSAKAICRTSPRTHRRLGGGVAGEEKNRGEKKKGGRGGMGGVILATAAECLKLEGVGFVAHLLLAEARAENNAPHHPPPPPPPPSTPVAQGPPSRLPLPPPNWI